MARPLRIELAGAIYHVTSRGDRREAVYEDDDDRLRWLNIFGETCKRYNWRCHAYCLMDNHYHVVIETAEANLSQGMRQLNGVYTQYFNRRHGRVGHVFQGRFKGILVEKDTYLLELARYVVLNPIRAGMETTLGTHPWTSFAAMSGLESPPFWLETSWLLGQFSKQKKRAIKQYINFVREGVGLPPIWNDLRKQILLGSEEYVSLIQDEIDKKNSLDDVPRVQRRAPAQPISFYKESYSDEQEAIFVAYATGAYSQKELGDFFGKHYSTISRMIRAYQDKRQRKT